MMGSKFYVQWAGTQQAFYTRIVILILQNFLSFSPSSFHQHPEDTPCLCRLSSSSLTCGILAVTALLGIAGIIGATTVQAAAVIHEQQQVGGAHSTVLGTRSFAFYTALVAFFTVKFLPLLRTTRKFLLSEEGVSRP